MLKDIFVLGTAGSGKSLLTSKLHEYYTTNGVFAAVMNLDPGVESLPYTPDVDVRDHVDILSVMRQYDLGPNGGLVMASDMVASRLGDIQEEADRINPDYLIVDTPGQIELFAYRSSGPFVSSGLGADAKTGLFLFDGAMVNSASNFVSVSLLAASIRLRLGLPCVNALSKSDLAGGALDDILGWAADAGSALNAAAGEVDGDAYSLISGMTANLSPEEYSQGMMPVSSATGEGLADLEAALSRILNQGEEVED